MKKNSLHPIKIDLGWFNTATEEKLKKLHIPYISVPSDTINKLVTLPFLGLLIKQI
ncbi:MAG TPA: hypothetical protein VF691_03600 [Cytophagaceae bacterium]|jgi:hypothetical protein